MTDQHLKALRQELDHLETALQRAGFALLAAEEANADPKELKELLVAYGIKANHPANRVKWLREHGQLLRWHQGLCATSELPDETEATGHVSRALIENTEA